MGRHKEFSKCCKGCGVEWNEDMSNKYPGRALCLPCAKDTYTAYRKAYHDSLDSNETKLAKMQPFKFENRQEHWNNINKEIRKLKDVKEIHQFIKERADEIFANKDLMEYINHQSLK